MTNIIEIELPARTAACVAGSSTDIPVTITKCDDRTFHLGRRLMPDALTPGEWLRFKGSEETRLERGERRTVITTVTVPPGAAARDHRFKILFFDMADPGERFVETGPILFDAVVPRKEASPDAVALKPRCEWSISILGGFALALIGAIELAVLRWSLLSIYPPIAFVVGVAVTTTAIRRVFLTRTIILLWQLLVVGLAFLDTESWITRCVGLALLGWTIFRFWIGMRDTSSQPLIATAAGNTGR